MKKIALDLDRLEVDSFATSTLDAPGNGTVHGHYSQIGTCDGRVATCQYGGTCGPGCGTIRRCTTVECV
jgi:hypothetical protein